MEDQIVEAVGSASGTGGTKGELNRAMERLMVVVVTECAAEGITDPDVIRERKLAARAELKAMYAEHVNNTSKEISKGV